MAEDIVYAEFDDKEVRQFLKSMDKRLDEVKNGKKKYTGLLSAIVFADIMEHFSKQQGPDGPWVGWSAVYKAQAEKEGRSEGANMLKHTGKLRNDFRPTNVRETPSGPMWFNPAQTSKGFPYAYWHDDDPKNPKKRPFMWMSDKAMDAVAEQTLQFMFEEGL